jgi:hypothetical protein
MAAGPSAAHMPRFFGHKQGVDALVRAINACADRGVEYLTVFAFSSENWKRPSDEVSGLMSLVLVAVTKYLTKLAATACASASWVTATRCPTSCAPPGTTPRPDPAQHPHHAVGGLQLRRPLGRGAGLPRAMAEACGPTRWTRLAVGAHGAELCARPRPVHPHRRRDAHQQLPALAGGLFRAVFTDCLWPDFGASADLAAGFQSRLQPSRQPPDPRPLLMLLQRVITAVVLLALLLPALFAPVSWPFAVLSLVLIAAAGWEWARLNGVAKIAAVGPGLLLALAGAWALHTGAAARVSPAVWWGVSAAWLVFGAVALRAGPSGWPSSPAPLRLFVGPCWCCGLHGWLWPRPRAVGELRPVGPVRGVGGRHRCVLRGTDLRSAQAGAVDQPGQELGRRSRGHGRRFALALSWLAVVDASWPVDGTSLFAHVRAKTGLGLASRWLRGAGGPERGGRPVRVAREAGRWRQGFERVCFPDTEVCWTASTRCCPCCRPSWL